MKKIIIIALYISIAIAQIQHGGIPKFFNNELDRIDFIEVETDLIVDRGFDPMVFQFGTEYDVNINVLSESQIYINDDNSYTFVLGIQSDGAYGLGFNFSDFFSNRVINTWNNLPAVIINSSSIQIFKTKLDNFDIRSIYTSKI